MAENKGGNLAIGQFIKCDVVFLGGTKLKGVKVSIESLFNKGSAIVIQSEEGGNVVFKPWHMLAGVEVLDD